MASTEAVVNTFNDFDIFEKAVQLSVIVHNGNSESCSFNKGL
jgi:hypothetical protein